MSDAPPIPLLFRCVRCADLVRLDATDFGADAIVHRCGQGYRWHAKHQWLLAPVRTPKAADA